MARCRWSPRSGRTPWLDVRPGGQVSPGAAPRVLVLHAHRLAGFGRQDWDGLRSRAWMLVFSSVEMTNSSSRRGLPCQRRSYRSRMRPALSWKCGSRGKIQQRCCHGRIASSCSQRHTVLSLMRATSPERSAWRATSAALSRDRGRPSVAGSSQASALISTVSSGGKGPRASRAGSFFQARQSLLEEALAPPADDLASRVQAGGDLVVVPALGGHEDHLGPNDLEIRQRILPHPTLQLLSLIDDRWMT